MWRGAHSDSRAAHHPGQHERDFGSPSCKRCRHALEGVRSPDGDTSIQEPACPACICTHAPCPPGGGCAPQTHGYSALVVSYRTHVALLYRLNGWQLHSLEYTSGAPAVTNFLCAQTKQKPVHTCAYIHAALRIYVTPGGTRGSRPCQSTGAARACTCRWQSRRPRTKRRRHPSTQQSR